MSSDQALRRRSLTESESFILKQIRDMYGEQNSGADVFFSEADEAIILVKDRNGVEGMMTFLTNLGAMYDDGTIGSLEELHSRWLCPR